MITHLFNREVIEGGQAEIEELLSVTYNHDDYNTFFVPEVTRRLQLAKDRQIDCRQRLEKLSIEHAQLKALPSDKWRYDMFLSLHLYSRSFSTIQGEIELNEQSQAGYEADLLEEQNNEFYYINLLLFAHSTDFFMKYPHANSEMM